MREPTLVHLRNGYPAIISKQFPPCGFLICIKFSITNTLHTLLGHTEIFEGFDFLPTRCQCQLTSGYHKEVYNQPPCVRSSISYTSPHIFSANISLERPKRKKITQCWRLKIPALHCTPRYNPYAECSPSHSQQHRSPRRKDNPFSHPIQHRDITI